MHLTFTGHRDQTADETALRDLLTAYPGATWEHGGAPGFDTQVDAFARKHGVTVRVTRPDYRRYPPHCAPLKRNDEMVSRADVVIALWDGRTTGGTYYTVQEARRQHKPVTVLKPEEKNTGEPAAPKQPTQLSLW